MFNNDRTFVLVVTVSVALLLAGCGGGSGGEPAATSGGDRMPSTGGEQMTSTFTSADVIPTLVRLTSAANSVVVSDVLDFSEDPPVRGQTPCPVAECTVESAELPPELFDPNTSTTIEAVAERRGVSLFRASGPYVDEDDAPYEDEWFIDFGGWLDHSYFLALADFHRPGGRLNGDVLGLSLGQATGTNPLSGAATWSGVMLGRDVSASATRGNEIQGNADLTIGNFAVPRLNVAFTNISDVDTGRRRADMTWDDVPLTGGGFSTGPDGNSVQGQFYGPNHEEVGGTFERDRVIGAFGAARGNVVVSCPAGGPACVVTFGADGTASHGVPGVIAAYGAWVLEVSCPAGGPACVVTVAADGTASYDRTGGVPGVMQVRPYLLSENHGIPSLGELRIQPGASLTYGDTEISCPVGGPACLVTIENDPDRIFYDETATAPAVGPKNAPLQRIGDQARSPIIVVHGHAILHVGPDVARSAKDLEKRVTHDDVSVSHGRVQDGVGADAIITYLTENVHPQWEQDEDGNDIIISHPSGPEPFQGLPTVRVREGTHDQMIDYVVRAIQLINSALPPEKRIAFDPEPVPDHLFSGGERFPDYAIPKGEIHINFHNDHSGVPGQAIQGITYGRIWINRDPDGGVGRSNKLQVMFGDTFDWNAIEDVTQDVKRRFAEKGWDWGKLIPNLPLSSQGTFSEDGDTSYFDPTIRLIYDTVKELYPTRPIYSIAFNDGDSPSPEWVQSLLVHELLHVLGLNHALERFVSIMGRNSRRDGHVLGAIDGEAIHAIYSGLDFEDLGSWSDTSTHIRGDFDTQHGPVAFGVALRNGLHQPWAFGPQPSIELSDNPALSGRATWYGRLLGFTAEDEAVAGDALFGVDLDTLDGQLDFTSLEHWQANAGPGEIGSGERWGGGNLGYTIEVRGNTFIQTGGDSGLVTGAFFGSNHEGMGGTLQRSDLTAAFGGRRQTDAPER